MNVGQLREFAARADGRALVLERARTWLTCRQRFDAAQHSADVTSLRPLSLALIAAEEQLAAALEELDR